MLYNGPMLSAHTRILAQEKGSCKCLLNKSLDNHKSTVMNEFFQVIELSALIFNFIV